MLARTAALALVVCSFAPVAWAQVVHRWVDANGVVQYGDRPLASTGTTLRIRAESATAPSNGAATAVARVAPTTTATAPSTGSSPVSRAAPRVVQRAAPAPGVSVARTAPAQAAEPQAQSPGLLAQASALQAQTAPNTAPSARARPGSGGSAVPEPRR